MAVAMSLLIRVEQRRAAVSAWEGDCRLSLVLWQVHTRSTHANSKTRFRKINTYV